ncbi:MAG: class I SAM-dependent methyltransferase [Brevefilum sp.]|nr:class I SAM-dependent methyltransferase [Brevefilum sp.]
MRMRIRVSRFLLGLGEFIQTLPIVIMKPDDLVVFSRQSYAKPGDVESWSEDALVNAGLNAEEHDLLKTLTTQKGNLLLLGVGGGREAIPMAEMGFQVTGVDYIPAMVDRAKENATRRGVEIDGFVQEISKLDVPEAVFDVVWISKSMYSCIPTRARRVQMVQRIRSALKPGGEFVCQFQIWAGQENRSKAERLRQLIAASPIGNRTYEDGDKLWLNVEFVHVFRSEDEVRTELEEGGLDIAHIKFDESSIRGAAVAIKTDTQTSISKGKT